jgi:hypothetical protein
MTISAVERKILWAAIEDFAGLWELVWELATICPKVAEPDRRSVAERTVRDLLERSCIELYVRSEIGGNEQLVPRARWDQLLSNEANWLEPSTSSIEVLVGATGVGEKVYARGGATEYPSFLSSGGRGHHPRGPR